jgi:hypothetical protein
VLAEGNGFSAEAILDDGAEGSYNEAESSTDGLEAKQKHPQGWPPRGVQAGVPQPARLHASTSKRALLVTVNASEVVVTGGNVSETAVGVVVQLALLQNNSNIL